VAGKRSAADSAGIKARDVHAHVAALEECSSPLSAVASRSLAVQAGSDTD